MITSKLARWFCLAVTLLVPLTGLAQKKPRIVFITHAQAGDPFWDVVRKGAETAAQETDSDVQYQSPGKFDLVEMSHLIDAAVASKPDGLIVSIPDVKVLGPSIRAAVSAKIPVISINSGLQVSRQLGCMMHIGQEEEAAGKAAGERMKAIGVTEVIILNQEAGNAGLDQRIKGFKDGFEGPFHHVDVLRVRIEFWACYNTVVAYLQQHEEIDGILALGPVAATPALKAVIDVDELGKIKLCTFDISREVVEALSKKQMSFAVDQQQWLQGYLPVVFLANYAKHGALPQNDLILTGPSFVTPENVDRVASLISKDPP
ncbi:MAG TPA: sugar ABC transporter substrate-binding protein [Chthoniobacterales bacterium]|nr:sugar ABC transporter substrate-binding protein [Chthoniobacterales bacterium]